MTDNRSTKPAAAGGNNAAVLLGLAWGFVGIPLALGVVKTVLNALALFQYKKRADQFTSH